MATNSKVLEIIITAKDEASKTLEGLTNSIKSHEKTFKGMAAVGGVAFTGLAAAIGYSTKEAIDAQSEQNRLVQILKTTHGVTKEQIKLLNDQAKALQKVGVVSDGNISIVQSQLATFDLTVDTLHDLTPAILDYVIAEKGASATTDDFKSMTNGLAQALQGNFASLTKTGFVLDDATKAMIENGTETERVQALVGVLGSTYEGFNETARQTAEGSMVALKNSFNEIAGTIGDTFLPLLTSLMIAIAPVITKISEWVEENPTLARNLLLVGLALSGVIAVIGILGLALPPIIAGFTLLAGPIGIITAILIGLGVVIYNVIEIFKILSTDLDLVWAGIKIMFKEAVDYIVGLFQPLFDVIDRVKSAMSSIGDSIKSGVSKVTSKLKGKAIGGGVQVGQSYLVGERGPELFTPSGNGSILPNHKLAGASGGNVTVNINGGTYLDPSVAEKIGDMIINRFRMSNRI